jgi:hypothetical protein
MRGRVQKLTRTSLTTPRFRARSSAEFAMWGGGRAGLHPNVPLRTPVISTVAQRRYARTVHLSIFCAGGTWPAIAGVLLGYAAWEKSTVIAHVNYSVVIVEAKDQTAQRYFCGGRTCQKIPSISK